MQSVLHTVHRMVFYKHREIESSLLKTLQRHSPDVSTKSRYFTVA